MTSKVTAGLPQSFQEEFLLFKLVAADLAGGESPLEEGDGIGPWHAAGASTERIAQMSRTTTAAQIRIIIVQPKKPVVFQCHHIVITPPFKGALWRSFRVEGLQPGT